METNAMFTTAVAMLTYKPFRFAITVAGLSCLFMLSACQVGLVVGWCNTVSALIYNANVDLWIMSPKTVAYDYGTPIPSFLVHEARSIQGVAWAEGIYMDWSMWQRSDGKRISIELVGLDDSTVGGPWKMNEGVLTDIHRRDSVVIDHAYLGPLGVERLGDEFELLGRRAIVRGISQDVRTFTASPFVFTSLEQARRFDDKYRADEVTYVLVRCQVGQTVADVQQRLAAHLTQHEILTTHEFAVRTMQYWMIETGVGITSILTALLGISVSAVVVSQTLFALTSEHARDYATLSAIGFFRGKLVNLVLLQSGLLGTVSWIMGSFLFCYLASMTAGTSVPLEMTPEVFAGLTLAHYLSCIMASFMSIRAILCVDPATVFRG